MYIYIYIYIYMYIYIKNLTFITKLIQFISIHTLMETKF